jgi:hypothetical protein
MWDKVENGTTIGQTGSENGQIMLMKNIKALAELPLKKMVWLLHIVLRAVFIDRCVTRLLQINDKTD